MTRRLGSNPPRISMTAATALSQESMPKSIHCPLNPTSFALRACHRRLLRLALLLLQGRLVEWLPLLLSTLRQKQMSQSPFHRYLAVSAQGAAVRPG